MCSKIQRYSPTDSAKTFEKPVNRKSGVKFDPKQVLELARLGTHLPGPIEQNKRQLIEAYIDVSRPCYSAHVQSQAKGAIIMKWAFSTAQIALNICTFGLLDVVHR